MVLNKKRLFNFEYEHIQPLKAKRSPRSPLSGRNLYKTPNLLPPLYPVDRIKLNCQIYSLQTQGRISQAFFLRIRVLALRLTLEEVQMMSL